MSNVIQHLERRILRLHYLVWQQKRHNQVVLEQIGDLTLIVLPQVMNPRIFRSGEFFATVLSRYDIAPHHHVLDMGAGSGIMALTAAKRAARVLAVDINPAAVRCTRVNALLNNLEKRIEVWQSNLFSDVRGETFDLILFNPPYFRGQPQEGFDQAWRSADAVERFAAELYAHLKPGGAALLVLSSDGDAASFLKTFEENGFDLEMIACQRFLAETFTVYRIRPHCKR